MKLILLEDDPLISIGMEEALIEAGFEMLTAAGGREALDLLAKTPDVVGLVVDVALDGTHDGWEVAHRARQLHPHAVIVYATAAGRSAYTANAVTGGILLEKPFTIDRVVAALRCAVSPQQASPAPPHSTALSAEN